MAGSGLYLFVQQKQSRVSKIFSLPAWLPSTVSQLQRSVKSQARQERIPVKNTAARKSNLEVTLPVFGAVTYVDKCDASYEESGSLIKDVPVLVGDMVKPGQVVAVIDTDILQEELKAKRANLDQMKALLDLAHWKYEAQRKVNAKGGSSLQELEEASATYQARMGGNGSDPGGNRPAGDAAEEGHHPLADLWHHRQKELLSR